MSLHSSFPSPDDSRSSQIIASLCGVFSHSCPPLPCLLSSSFSLQLLPFMFPPSFQFAPILSPSIPLWTLRPQISSVPGEKKQRGWEKGKKGGVGDRSWMEELQKHAGLQRWADGQNESQKVALKISQLKTTSAAAYLESMNWSFCTHTHLRSLTLTLTLTRENWLHQIRRGENTDTCLSIRNVTALPHCSHQRS